MAAIFFHLITLDGRRLFTGSSALVLGTANRNRERKKERKNKRCSLARQTAKEKFVYKYILNSILLVIIIHLPYTSFGVYKVWP